jgi:hypothetical protein
MEGVRAAMKTRHLEEDQWLNRKELSMDSGRRRQLSQDRKDRQKSHSSQFNNFLCTCKVSIATNFPISVVLHLYASSATLPKLAVTFGKFQVAIRDKSLPAEIMHINRQYANLNIHVLHAPLPITIFK